MLNRLEWIKFVAAFFNREAFAEQIYNTISDRYNYFKQQVSALSNDDSDSRSAVFVQYTAPFGEAYPESWRLESAVYLDELLMDAGAKLHPFIIENINNDNNSESNYVFDNVQDVQEALLGMDYVFDLTYAYDPLQYTQADFLNKFGFSQDDESSFEGYPFLENGNLFRVDKKINSGYYGNQYGFDW